MVKEVTFQYENSIDEVFNRITPWFGADGGSLSLAEKDGKFYVFTGETFFDDEEEGGGPFIMIWECDSEKERQKFLKSRGWHIRNLDDQGNFIG